MVDKLTLDRIHDALEQWRAGTRVERIEVIAPDVSLRRYYRVFLEGEVRSVVVMIFDSTKAAEVGGGPAVTADQAVVELTNFFDSQGVKVPQLYFDGRKHERIGDLLLIEDLGVRTLASLWRTAECEPAYRQAIDQICAIQKAKAVSTLFAFQRGFSTKVYISEMSEFVDFLLPDLAGTAEITSAAPTCFAWLAAEIEKLPQTLVHRDFHSWNLLLDPQGVVRVIDFQDALLGPLTYDLVSLLHDRDTDSGLGAGAYQSLLDYGRESLRASFSRAQDFDRAFMLVSAQRDLKVAGRFAKLVNTRGLRQYGHWIPGTTARLLKALAGMADVPAVVEFYAAMENAELLKQVRRTYAG